MGSELGFLGGGNNNELVKKLNLGLDLKVRPEVEDPDVVERCPNNRYVRV